MLTVKQAKKLTGLELDERVRVATNQDKVCPSCFASNVWSTKTNGCNMCSCKEPPRADNCHEDMNKAHILLMVVMDDDFHRYYEKYLDKICYPFRTIYADATEMSQAFLMVMENHQLKQG